MQHFSPILVPTQCYPKDQRFVFFISCKEFICQNSSESAYACRHSAGCCKLTLAWCTQWQLETLSTVAESLVSVDAFMASSAGKAGWEWSPLLLMAPPPPSYHSVSFTSHNLHIKKISQHLLLQSWATNLAEKDSSNISTARDLSAAAPLSCSSARPITGWQCGGAHATQRHQAEHRTCSAICSAASTSFLNLSISSWLFFCFSCSSRLSSSIWMLLTVNSPTDICAACLHQGSVCKDQAVLLYCQAVASAVVKALHSRPGLQTGRSTGKTVTCRSMNKQNLVPTCASPPRYAKDGWFQIELQIARLVNHGHALTQQSRAISSPFALPVMSVTTHCCTVNLFSRCYDSKVSLRYMVDASGITVNITAGEAFVAPETKKS